MRRISVPLYALALAGGVALGVVFVSGVVFWVFGGDDDQPRQVMPLAREEINSFGFPTRHLAGSRYRASWPSDEPNLVAAETVGRTHRYVLKQELPARFLGNRRMSSFLEAFRFGVRGRKMVVRLLDGDGRFAWAAGWDGVGNMWARVPTDLVLCGPIYLRRSQLDPLRCRPIATCDPVRWSSPIRRTRR